MITENGNFVPGSTDKLEEPRLSFLRRVGGEMRAGPLAESRATRLRTPRRAPGLSSVEPDDALRARLIEEDFDIADGAQVFEITVGDPPLAAHLLALHGDLSIITLDLSTTVADADPTAPCLPGGTNCALPLPARSYDRGFCYLTLARLDRGQAIRVLEDVARVLKPGGRFRFAVPDRDVISFRRKGDRLLAPFGREEVFDLVEGQLGFQVVSMRAFDADGPSFSDDAGTHLLFDLRNPARQ
jgi:SAM-dependent methyltransferase